MTPPLIAAPDALRAALADWRGAGARIGFVPTMGALHAGHLSLVERARRVADRVVVSIFVNPTQFAPNEDFAAYPRRLDDDRRALAAGGADLVFNPDPEAIYPDGFATTVTVGGPALTGLEDAARPTHFAGVATVVTKLLLLVQPQVAVFGEKDFQQLAVVRRLTRDLGLPVEILAGPTFREPDGLAMSSRNAYLTREQRAVAPMLFEALTRAAAALRGGDCAQEALDTARRRLQEVGFVIDYVELRDGRDLTAIDRPTPSARLLAAARLGRTRLIDNVAVAANQDSGS
jgi:pantoate--beta-alanine ligase